MLSDDANSGWADLLADLEILFALLEDRIAWVQFSTLGQLMILRNQVREKTTTERS